MKEDTTTSFSEGEQRVEVNGDGNVIVTLMKYHINRFDNLGHAIRELSSALALAVKVAEVHKMKILEEQRSKKDEEPIDLTNIPF